MYDIGEFVRKRIQELRTTKGVSAREMSLSMGQGNSYITQVENGAYMPSLEVLSYICDYFGITAKDFFDSEIVYPEKVNELIRECNRFDTETLDEFISIAGKINRRERQGKGKS